MDAPAPRRLALPFTLDELERDALAEMGNIGIAKASTALSRMIGGPVEISVPAVELLTLAGVSDTLSQVLPGPLIGVSERLEGALRGVALLVFPQSGSLPLVHATLPPGFGAEDAAALEDEALAEIGNVVLNSGIAQVANLLGADVQTELPTVGRGDAAAILSGSGLDLSAPEPAIVFHIAFRATTPDVGGRVVLALDPLSMAVLKDAVGRYIGRILQ